MSCASPMLRFGGGAFGHRLPRLSSSRKPRALQLVVKRFWHSVLDHIQRRYATFLLHLLDPQQAGLMPQNPLHRCADRLGTTHATK